MSYIEVQNLKYRYPHTDFLALSDISFSADRGEFIGVAGENGAGKSTLCQALLGLVPNFYKGAYGGRVCIDGMEAAKTPVSRLCKTVGLIFQNPFNQLSGAKDTVFEEVAFGLQNMGIPAKEMAERVEEALVLMDIERYRERNPFDLSGGQMQRVAIASVLAMKPGVIVLDEPTSQLDPQGGEEVFRAVEALARAGITIVMVEQKQEKLAAFCDRILLMQGGKQVAFDTPQRVYSRDDLDALGIQAPAAARICMALDLKDAQGSWPVTQEQAAVVLAERESGDGDVRSKPGGAYAEKAVMSGAADWKDRSPIFEIRGLKFSYDPDTPVIGGLDLDLDGRTTAVIGQNGAGKTTLVKLLKGLLKPADGSIRYCGEDISKKTVAALSSEVGYVFQNPDDQIFKYNVLDEVMFGPLNIGMSKERARELAMNSLGMAGLANRAGENPYDLELCQRKMIAIASVLAMDTSVIILDEPTIAQDQRGKERIRRIIRENRAQGKLVLAILHDMDFVAESFERVIVMANGQILADGRAGEVFKQPRVLKEARLMLPQTAALSRRLGREELSLTVEDFLRAERGRR